MATGSSRTLTRTLGPVQLTVLGSSGTYPSRENPASSYLVTDGSTAIWCDAGPGSYQALLSVMDPRELSAIVISHRHPDHCTDLFALFHAITYSPRPIEGLTLIANRSVIDHAERFLDAGEDHAVHRAFDIRPTEGGDILQVGAIEVTAVEMDHSAPTLGFRFESDAQSIFYTADTGPGGDWQTRVGPVDLLVSEASMQGASLGDGSVLHLTASQAGEIASRLGATRLLLTHIPPHLDPIVSVREAEATFGKTVMAAVPGATHEV